MFLRRLWADNPAGHTPITAAELNRMEAGIADEESHSLLMLASQVDPLIAGNIVRDSLTLVAISATLLWPDGTPGHYTATAFHAATGAVNAYTVTYEGATTTVTYTQPAMTRNAAGAVTVRPAMTVS